MRNCIIVDDSQRFEPALSYQSEVTLQVRTSGEPLAMAAAVEQTIHSLMPIALVRHDDPEGP